LATGSGGSITVSLSAITWSTDPASTPPGPPWNGDVAGSLGTTSPTFLTFAGCGTGVLGAAGCLDAGINGPNEGIEINGNVPLTPSTVLPENNFLTFAGNGTTHVAIDYTLTQVLAGSTNSNCAGLGQFQSCSINILGQTSPIVLTLEGTGTTATLNLLGTVSDGVGIAANWSGKFSATFPTTTPEQILLALCPSGTCTAADVTANRTESTSNSGTFNSTTVPEPSYTVVLIGGGLIGLAMAIRRKKHTLA